MAKCGLCGKRIQPYLEICDNCHHKTFALLEESSSRLDFIENMGINICEN